MLKSATRERRNRKNRRNLTIKTDGFFEVGVVTAPFGVKGFVKVYPVTDDPRRFSLLRELHTDNDLYKIESLYFHKNLVNIKFAGIDNIDAAEKLRGKVLKIPPELALPLSENEYYHRDLLEMNVYENDGRELGVLTKIIHTGANDVYTVKLKDGGELLVPAIKQCVLSVDIGRKRMTVKLLPGL